jgi:hypothetical protein
MMLTTAMRSAGLGGAIAAPVLVAIDATSPARTLAVVLLFALAPGAALLSRSAGGSGASETALVVALSLAVAIVTAQLLLAAGAWSTELAVYGLAAACAPPLALALVHPRRRSRGA